jgi:hypothetical protein
MLIPSVRTHIRQCVVTLQALDRTLAAADPAELPALGLARVLVALDEIGDRLDGLAGVLDVEPAHLGGDGA